MKLIDADALIDKTDDRYSLGEIGRRERDDIVNALEYAPTITAQPKTGKWITVHGYCTPGGDPVWACSECGKGIHVYGIEHGSYGRDVSDGQWKACPNCGCRMMKEGE